jgi:hypothetical protein
MSPAEGSLLERLTRVFRDEGALGVVRRLRSRLLRAWHEALWKLRLTLAPLPPRRLLAVSPVPAESPADDEPDELVRAGRTARSLVRDEREEAVRLGRERFEGRSVLFLLPVATPGGGANVVIHEARAMRRMGIAVSLFNLARNERPFRIAYPDLDLPIRFGDEHDVPALGRACDAVVATLNTSVAWLERIPVGPGRPVLGYYVQEFEPYMYADGSRERREALASYTRLPGMIRFAKTGWTASEVREQAGVPCAEIGVSLDLDLFRPRPRRREEAGRPLRIAAMIRPASFYRQPLLTMRVLKEVARRFGPRVEIVLFGMELSDPGFAPLPRDFPWRLAGVLTQRQVARLMSEADLFLDLSSHQAMGLTALEAMASGAAVAVPLRGGAVSYARDDENALLADTSDFDACLGAASRLVEDGALRRRLQERAVRDVCAFHPEGPALRILVCLFSGGA